MEETGMESMTEPLGSPEMRAEESEPVGEEHLEERAEKPEADDGLDHRFGQTISVRPQTISVRPELVEGPTASPEPFDKLRANGDSEAHGRKDDQGPDDVSSAMKNEQTRRRKKPKKQ